MCKLTREQWISVVLVALSVILIAVAVAVLATSERKLDALTLLVAAASALMAAFSAHAGLRQADTARRQVEQLQQPNVVAYFELRGRHDVTFTASNIGNAPALDVRIDFDAPCPEDPWNNRLGYTDPPIMFLAPNHRLAQYFGSVYSLEADKRLSEYRATITYEDARGTPYSVAVSYDLSYMKTTLLPGPTIEQQLGRIGQALDTLVQRAFTQKLVYSYPPVSSPETSLAAIAKNLEAIAQHVQDSAGQSGDSAAATEPG